MNYTYSDITSLSIYKKLLKAGWLDVCTERQKKNCLIALHHEKFTAQNNVQAAIFIKYPYFRLSNDGKTPYPTSTTRPIVKNFKEKYTYKYDKGFKETTGIEKTGIIDNINFMRMALEYAYDNYSTNFNQIVSKKFENTYYKALEKIKNNKSFYCDVYDLENKDKNDIYALVCPPNNKSFYYEINVNNVTIRHRRLISIRKDIKAKKLVIKTTLEEDILKLTNILNNISLNERPITYLHAIGWINERSNAAKKINPNIAIDIKITDSEFSYEEILEKFKDDVKEIALEKFKENIELYTKHFAHIIKLLNINVNNKDVELVDDFQQFGTFD